MENKRKYDNQHLICQYCGHNFGEAKVEGQLRMTCPKCGADLDFKVTKYSVKAERRKKAS